MQTLSTKYCEEDQQEKNENSKVFELQLQCVQRQRTNDLHLFYISMTPIQIRTLIATHKVGRVAVLGGVGREAGSETGVGEAPIGTEIGPMSGLDRGVGVDTAGLSGAIGMVTGVEMG